MQASDNGEALKAPPISIRTVVLPILIGLTAVFFIGYLTFEPDMFRRVASALNPWILLGAVATVGMREIMGGLRLSHVSHGLLSFKGGVKGQLAWDFASNITPSLVGGAPIAAYFIARSSAEQGGRRIRFGEVTAFMMFILLLDQTWFALSVLVLLFSTAFVDVIPASVGTIGATMAVLYFLAFMLWTVFFGYATLYRPSLLGRIVDFICRIWFLRRFRDRVKAEMEEYQERARTLRSQPVGFFAKGLFLTCLTWVSRNLLVVFIVWSIYPQADHLLLFLRSMMMTLGAIVMPTPGGAGGVEALYALFFASTMPRAFLAPSLFIWRFLGYYIFLGIGVLMSTRQVQKSMRARRLGVQKTNGSQESREEVIQHFPE